MTGQLREVLCFLNQCARTNNVKPHEKRVDDKNNVSSVQVSIAQDKLAVKWPVKPLNYGFLRGILSTATIDIY